MGYTQASWDNVLEIQPDTAFKSWDQLLVCGEGEYVLVSPRIPPPLSVLPQFAIPIMALLSVMMVLVVG